MATLTQAAAAFARCAAMMPMAERRALELGCQIIEKEAKEAIGTYRFGWAPLTEWPIRRHGDTPLLETGEMRDSIEHVVHAPTAEVGTNNQKAVWQELGTSRGIPPRTFMMGAAMRKGQEVADVTGRVVVATIEAGLGIGGLPFGYAHWAGPTGTPIQGGTGIGGKVAPRSITRNP